MFEKEYKRLEVLTRKILAVKGVIAIDPFYVHDTMTIVCKKKDKERVQKEVENIMKEE